MRTPNPLAELWPRLLEDVVRQLFAARERMAAHAQELLSHYGEGQNEPGDGATSDGRPPPRRRRIGSGV